MTDTTPADEQCCEVPLIELLRRVPRDARFWERTETESTHYPVGRLCHEAADALEQARAALSQQAEPEWHDEKSDQWTAEIEAAHPVNTKAHDAYGTAMQMVGNRRSKRALVNLVCWLLQRAAPPADDEAVRKDAQRYRGLRTAYLEKWFYFPCDPFDTARAETEQDCDNAIDAYLAKVRKV
jgi:hypothetical protein